MNENIFWLGINIYHEARGESQTGQIAVGHVCLNRAAKRHLSVKEVVLQKHQFSWHNGDKYPSIRDYGSLLRSFDTAQMTVDERLKGETLAGADHYFATYIDPPRWAKDMKFITKIGMHKFFKE